MNCTVSGAQPLVVLWVKMAVGGTALTVTVWVNELVPQPLVTVKMTVKVPVEV